jgi:hypothetical protein
LGRKKHLDSLVGIVGIVIYLFIYLKTRMHWKKFKVGLERERERE